MAEQIVGLSALERRLSALASAGTLGKPLMNALALMTVREAKLLVPRRTGNLGRTIHAAAVSDTSAQVVASAGYAAYVEHGTRPHEITPNAARALRWAASAGGARLSGTPRTGAAVVFAMRVHHPGTKPKPFMMPGARAAIAKGGLADQVVAVWNENG